MPQATPHPEGPSEEFPGFPGTGTALTEADADRVAADGLWVSGGTVHPEAVRFARTVLTALLDDAPADWLLPPALARRVEEVRVDLAGPHDVADGSTVVDFGVEHFAPASIGFLGQSYGSGISRLVAAHDERVAAVTWRLQAAAYDIPAGHRLMLVVDSKDPLYAAASVTWTQTVVGSPPGAAAFLELPLG
ncbi:hypothetical protein [Streptomyces griseus]|uniref:hypothetical protein n=1 Tax=Streptomyces griseus TaxID=1911 RepID=UPI0004C9F5A3|nr:hypothetical protein [Streptomyces griseus]